MAKKQIKNYIFEPGISKDSNLLPKAVSLIAANKEFLQAQVVAFINAQIAGNQPPYNGYTYAPQKCTRDVGFFIDAILHDLRYGGNIKVRQVADYFWIDGEPMIRGDVTPETTGQAYLRDIINNFIFTNTAVTPNYNQTSVSQVFISGQNAEVGASARNTTLWNIFSSVITNGITALPAKQFGVSSLRLLEKYDSSDILLITDGNNGNVLYNFADPSNNISFEYKQGRSSGDGQLLSDVDFRSWWHTTDTITTVYLSADTTNLSSTDNIQIFVEEPYITTRPWTFGTDAIERIRVSNPQAMLDADFEYGLQPTKWQALGLIRSYPSLYEIPGTDFDVISITTDASINTAGFGASLITVVTSAPHGLSRNQPITVKGLLGIVPNFSRAEGSFLVFSTPRSNTFTYYSSAKVGTSNGESLYTSSIQIRQANYYTGASIGQPTYSVFSNGSSLNITTKFDTPENSTGIAYSGSAPDPGSPITGSLNIASGTSVSGNIGSALVIDNVLDSVTSIDNTSITVINLVGIQQGMAIDGGSNNAVFINSILGNTLNLSNSIGQLYKGRNGVNAGVSGTIVQSIGSSAVFNVSKSGEAYTVTDAEDSSANGQDYFAGDQITISGTDVGGISPENDILIFIDQVDSGGSIVSFSFSGIASIGDASYSSVTGTNTTLTASDAVFSVSRLNGLYSAIVSNAGSGYRVGNRIVISGSDLDGTSPAHDATLTVTTIGGGGSILTVTSDGDTYGGDPITIYPIVTLSDPLIGSIPDGTVLESGAIATIQVNFNSPHGIVPGTTMFNQITSNPPPEFESIDRTLSSSGNWVGIAFASDYFVAIRTSSNQTAVSVDGINWSAGGNLPSSTTWTSIAGGTVNGTTYFVAVASGGTAAAWSNDLGLTWTLATLPASGTWNSVAYFDGTFVTVCATATVNGAAYSLDGGQTWTGSNLPASVTMESVTGGFIGTSVFFVAVASGGTAAAFSADAGVNWSAMGALPASATWRDVIYGNNRFVAIARGSTNAAVSTNGISWTQSVLPSSANWNCIAFGDENFVVIADGGTQALTSSDGTTGSWQERTLSSSATWEEVTFGFINGSGIFSVVGNGTSALSIVLTSANHQLAAGPFTITQVPTLSSLRYPARGLGFIDTTSPISGSIYVRPDAFFVHRPFDGGVQLGTGGPSHGAQAVRQSKKYIRYQSGKGMMYTTGALFAPNYNLSSASATGSAINSLITFTTDDTDHGLQPGAEVEVIGMVSFEYNGEYVVESIVDSRSFRVRSQAVLSSLTGTLGSDAKVLLKRWRGATVRVGPFDDQNGLFFQYDGQQLAVVKRGSTNQLIGTVAVSPESNRVTGTSTKFQDQLKVGDKIVLRGMSHTVTSIDSQTSLTFSPDWRGARAVVGGKMAITEDLIFPQSEWNIDKLDGTGPSNYNFLPWRMQMIGMQYTWYAAGFVEFMLRGSDGKFIFLHRIRNSNVNTEAYMRTANLPVRYEVENASARSKLKSAITESSTSLTLSNATRFPTTGIVYVDNELISYNNKNGDTLTGLSRSASLTNYSTGLNRTYTAGEAVSHAAGAGVILVGCTASPTINHWGSALLTDGYFDEDRGYLFSYAATGLSISTTKRTAFMIRLAPSVSNAIVGDLGDRDLLNRAQLLLKEISITINAQNVGDQGAIIIEGVLNPINYPSNPANITWTTLSTSGAGGQPSFAQIAGGGSINWGGIAPTTTTATIQGALTTTSTARAFNSVNRTLVAESPGFVGGEDYSSEFDTTRNTFLILNSNYDSFLNSTPIRIGDRLSVNPFLTSNQTIAAFERSFAGSQYTKITMNAPPNNSSNIGGTVNVTATSVISITYANALSTARNDFLMTDSDVTFSGIAVGDTLSLSSILTSGQTVTAITPSFARVNGTLYTRITMNTVANGTSGFNSNQSVTITAAGTSSSYSGNFIFFTNSTWNSSGATVGTGVAASFTQFPAGTSVATVVSRRLAFTTVQRVTFTQSLNASVNSASTVTFQFGDPQFAIPGEQVFSFVANSGSTTDLDLSELKELTTTAIGGRGTFPNGPDVLAINVLKVGGAAAASSVILRWGEAQA